jgi:glycosyltransferase involved in cell wall biosynthesis
MQREAFQNLAFHEIPSGVALLPVARSVSEVKAGLPVKGARLVGYLGRYHAHKGFDIFLDLARAAHEHYGGRFAFVSAGVGWITPDPISNYADLGWVKADLGGLVNALDLVVAPNRYSFFDLAMLEAMSLAKPLVTSAHGGNRWIAGTSDGVVLVDRDDPLAYLDVLARIDREGSYDQLGRANARAFATHFTLEAFVERHVAFTRRLLG